MTRRAPLVLLVPGAAIALGLGWVAARWARSAAPHRAPVSAVAPAAAPQETRLEPASEGRDPATVEDAALADPLVARERAPESTDERSPLSALTAIDLRDAIWVEGRVIVPDGTPADEAIEIVAKGKDFEHGDEHRVRAEPDGSFRVAFAARTRRGWLTLDAPHLYLEDPVTVRPAETEEPIVLEPRLGAHLRGTLVPPAGAVDDASFLVGRTVELWSEAEPATETRERSTTVSSALAFEFKGIPPHQPRRLIFDPERWAALDRPLEAFEPGATQTLELELAVGARLVCRIVDEHGESVDDATVHVLVDPTGGRRSSARRATAAGEGRYELAGITPGKARISAEHPARLSVERDLGELDDGSIVEGIELCMPAGETMAGRVLWPDGSPVEGARISIVPADSPTGSLAMQRWFEAAQSEHRSAADGTFRVSGLTGGPFHVRAHAASAAPADGGSSKTKRGPPWHAEAERVAGGEDALVLTLRPGPAVSGIVLDDTSAPVRRFTVTARRGDFAILGNSALFERYESDDGRFVLEGFGDGEWEVTVSANGHIEASSHVLLPRNAGEQRFVLTRAARISGVVVDLAGQPVAKAYVRVKDETPRAGFFWVGGEPQDRTDREGRFEIDDASIGAVIVTASRTDAATSEPLRLVLEPAQVVDGLVLRLRAGGRLTGEVHRDAAPVAGREIRLSVEDRSTEPQLATTDDAGRFVFDPIAPGRYDVSLEPLEKLARNDPDESELDWISMLSQRRTRSVTITDGESAHVVLGEPSRSPVEVEGVVRRGVRPVEGVRIVAFSDSDAVEARLHAASTASDGTYRLVLDGPGTYGFSLLAGDGATQISRSETIPDVARATIDFELPAGRIAGRVVAPDGSPAAGVDVAVEIDASEAELRPDGIYGHVRTDDAGAFAFDGLPAGSYTVSASGEDRTGFAQVPRFAESKRAGLVLEEGGELDGIELELSEPCTIEGSVRTASGTPAAGSTLIVWDERGEWVMSSWGTQTDAGGRYVVRGLAPGTWSVGALRGEDVAEPSAPVTIADGGDAEIDLALRAGTMLRVRVLGASGQPVGAAISVRDARNREHGSMRAESAEPGTTLVGPLPPGTYRVTAANHDRVTATATTTVGGAPVSELELVLGG